MEDSHVKCIQVSKRIRLRWLMRRMRLAVSAWLFLGFTSNFAFADGDYTLTLAARPLQKPNLDPRATDTHAMSLTGHAYMIIGRKTSSGVKEEVYGFYPVASSGKGVVKGPGMLKAEYRCGPNDDCNPKQQAQLLKRLSETSESVQFNLSSSELNDVYRVMKRWDSKSYVGADNRQVVPSSDKAYDLTNQNCIDFVNAVASALDYPTPDRSATQLPVDYIKRLKPLVEQEKKLRQEKQEKMEAEARAEREASNARRMERERNVANAKAKDAEARSQAAEARMQAAEDRSRQLQSELENARANAIPAGWIPCNCPNSHRGTGKIINGTLYHGAGLECP